MSEQDGMKPTAKAAEVHAYLGLLQGVVNRMAGNSALCKTLCITLVAAVAAIAASAKSAGAVWVALIPLLVFAALDIVYLSLERGFRATYNRTVENLHKGELHQAELFVIKPEKGYASLDKLFKTARSWSVWLAYGPLTLLLLIIWLII